MPQRRGKKGIQQAATEQGDGHEQAARLSDQQEQEQEQEQEQPSFTSILLGLATKAATAATKAATAAKEAQEAARAAGNAAQAAAKAAAEAAQASQTAADAAAAMAEALQQLHLHEEREKEKEAARLMALQQERQQEVWEVCISTRVLSSFLGNHDLCALSICSHLHLPVRRQISKVVARTFTPSLLSSMAAGSLAKVKVLQVNIGFYGFTTTQEFSEAAERAFQQMHKLEYLCLQDLAKSSLCSIFGALGVEGKRWIKSVTLGIIKNSLDSEMPESYYDSILFRGFTSLESLTVKAPEFEGCYEALKNGNFPRLQTLRLTDERDGIHASRLGDLIQLMLHGSLRHVSSLTFNLLCAGGVEELEKLLSLLPRVKYLSIKSLCYDFEATAVERLMTRAAEEGCHVFIEENDYHGYF